MLKTQYFVAGNGQGVNSMDVNYSNRSFTSWILITLPLSSPSSIVSGVIGVAFTNNCLSPTQIRYSSSELVFFLMPRLMRKFFCITSMWKYSDSSSSRLLVS